MTAYEIPPDLRPWCEVTAPKCTTLDWSDCRLLLATPTCLAVWLAGPEEEVDRTEARALLAYADEVAAGLRSLSYDVVLARYRGALLVGPRVLSGPGVGQLARVQAAMDSIAEVAKRNGLRLAAIVLEADTDWGRYIAERAAALRGER